MATAQNARSKNKPKRKIALVIGIGNYSDGQNLPNAIKDAEDVTAALKRMGFIIEKPELDLDYTQMEVVIVKFKCSIKAGDLVFFYFSGHGVQWENQNYLIPSNNIEIDDHELYNYAINAQQKLSSFNERKPFATILILDCCRTYHLSRNINLDTPVTRSRPTKKLDEPVQMLGDESLTMFSCADGTTASDGISGRNGRFTKHLLQHIETANKSVYTVLLDVMRGVKEESKLVQIPKMYTSLTYSDLYLNEQMLNELQPTTPKKKSSYSDEQLDCKGRACAECGKCRDWFWRPDGNMKVYTKRYSATCRYDTPGDYVVRYDHLDYDYVVSYYHHRLDHRLDYDDHRLDYDLDYNDLWHSSPILRRDRTDYGRDLRTRRTRDRLCECKDNRS